MNFMIFQSECGTSMELHTPHSTEKSAPLSVDWISRHSSFDNGSNDLLVKSKTLQSDPIPDENESRGSPAGSPKSFDSHSSIEDKVATAIRHCPVPRSVKAGKFAEEDDVDDDDTMDSVAGSASGISSAQPTSNLVQPLWKLLTLLLEMFPGFKLFVNCLISQMIKHVNLEK